MLKLIMKNLPNDSKIILDQRLSRFFLMMWVFTHLISMAKEHGQINSMRNSNHYTAKILHYIILLYGKISVRKQMQRGFPCSIHVQYYYPKDFRKLLQSGVINMD